jgi:hypothetical protein
MKLVVSQKGKIYRIECSRCKASANGASSSVVKKWRRRVGNEKE